MSRSDDTEPAERSFETVDPDAPPSEDELRAAERLRLALDERLPGDATWDFAESVRAAAAPIALAPERSRQILAGALAKRPGKVVYLALGGAVSLAAMAAAVALVMRPGAPRTSAALESPASSSARAARPASPALPPDPGSVALSRSAASLFPEGIPVSGGTSDRVDRIAYARSQDLRDNRFARWGIR